MVAAFGRRGALALACVLALMGLGPWGGAESVELGMRFGNEPGGDQAFHSRELFIAEQIPFPVGSVAGWDVETRIEARVGRLRGGGDALRHGGFSLGVRLRDPNSPLVFGVGSGPTWMTETTLGDRDFGGPWQFTSHLVIQFRLSDALRFGYRIQHTSNAGLSSPNEGVDIQSFELRLLF